MLRSFAIFIRSLPPDYLKQLQSVPFHLHSSYWPLISCDAFSFRIENRTRRMMMRIRQSGFGDDTWIQLCPLSTTNFSWEDPYGQKYIDAEIREGSSATICKFDLNSSGLHSEGEGLGLLLHVLDLVDIRVARFLDETTLLPCPREGSRSEIHVGSLGNSHIESKMQENGSPLELIVEMQAVGVSVVDHRPKELSYLYLERVFMSYSTGYDGGTTSRCRCPPPFVCSYYIIFVQFFL